VKAHFDYDQLATALDERISMLLGKTISASRLETPAEEFVTVQRKR